MAGNFGKYKDRSPVICPAGKQSGNPGEGGVPEALKQIKVVDEIAALKHDAKIWKEDEFVLPKELPPYKNPNFRITNSEMKPIMCPPVLTRYQQFILDLKETTYDSYWNKEIGKVRDPTPGLPAGTDIYGKTFGIPSNKDISVKLLVNPPKSHYEVLQESQKCHEMYRKTHNDYNPSEQVCRNYFSPPFNPHKCFGGKTTYDPRGIWVRCACDWYEKEPVVSTSKIESDYIKRTKAPVGKVLAPNDNIKCVPEGHRFGDPTEKDIYNVEDLLKDHTFKPDFFRKEFLNLVATLNKFKITLKEKCIKGSIDLIQFRKKALYLDKDKCGILPIEVLYELCACNNLTFPKHDLESLMTYLKIIENGYVHYNKFIDLIESNGNVLDISKMQKDPELGKYFLTTYQSANNCDPLMIDNSKMPAAGIPSIRYDLPRPVVPHQGCRADLDHLGNDTSAKAVLNPSMYTNYGLTYRDFFVPRSAEIIRSLFEKCGHRFPGDSFQQLWKAGLEIDGTDGVCVETFKRLLERNCQQPKLIVDEKDRDCEMVK